MQNKTTNEGDVVLKQLTNETFALKKYFFVPYSQESQTSLYLNESETTRESPSSARLHKLEFPLFFVNK